MLSGVGDDEDILPLDRKLAERVLALDLGDVYSVVRLQPDVVPIHDADECDRCVKHFGRAAGDLVQQRLHIRLAEMQSLQLGQAFSLFSRCPGIRHDSCFQRALNGLYSTLSAGPGSRHGPCCFRTRIHKAGTAGKQAGRPACAVHQPRGCGDREERWGCRRHDAPRQAARPPAHVSGTRRSPPHRVRKTGFCCCLTPQDSLNSHPLSFGIAR
ncbi:MAG: hypothetical protein BWY59_02511 [Verrucomicrobia bacterium ADurb.Bin345]|nr:MAG: hypothetical protein BWY59_02511 [Verrucomicrobia bacterium ADurb.Bin345]